MDEEKQALQDRIDALEEALHRIVQWADAYPATVFPEPDWSKARQLLEAGGLTLDRIAASNMRYAIKGVGEIARKVLLLNRAEEILTEHPYPSNYRPGTHWSVDEAWEILDQLPVGILPDDHRFLIAGMIAGALLKASKKEAAGQES